MAHCATKSSGSGVGAAFTTPASAGAVRAHAPPALPTACGPAATAHPNAEAGRPVSYHVLLRRLRRSGDGGVEAVGCRGWQASVEGAAAGPRAAASVQHGAMGVGAPHPGLPAGNVEGGGGGGGGADAPDAAQQMCCLVTGRYFGGGGGGPTTASVSVKVEAAGSCGGGLEVAAGQLQAAALLALNQAAASIGVTVVHYSSVCFPGCLHLIMRVLMVPEGAEQRLPSSSSGHAVVATAAAGRRTPQLQGGAHLLDGQCLVDELQGVSDARLLGLSLVQQPAGGSAVERWVWEASQAGGPGAAEQTAPQPGLQWHDHEGDGCHGHRHHDRPHHSGDDPATECGPGSRDQRGGPLAHLCPVVIADWTRQRGAAQLPLPHSRVVKLMLSTAWVARLRQERRGLRLIVSSDRVRGVRALACGG